MSESRGEPVAEVRYKAGDVCRIADVQPYVLRYWESEFSVLAPERGAPGPRLYTSRDVKIIERIKKLLYDEGYTIAGAKKRLEGELKSDATAATVMLAEPAAAAKRETRPARDDAPRHPVPAPSPAPEPVKDRGVAEVAEFELASASSALERVTLEPSGPDARPRRARARVVVSEPAPEPAPPLFDPEPAQVRATPAPQAAAGPRRAAVTDPRLALVVSELKEILALLSREGD